MTLFDQTVPPFVKMLGNLASWLDEAERFCESREMDPELLLDVRLYPDQFPLRKNLQSACDTAKLTAVRLTEREAPSHEDGAQSLAELRARIAEVRAWLEGLDEAAYAGAESKMLSPSMLQGMSIRGDDYVVGFAVPNFYFHVTTSYAILRHCGVKLGKLAYIGSLPLVAGD